MSKCKTTDTRLILENQMAIMNFLLWPPKQYGLETQETLSRQSEKTYKTLYKEKNK